VDAVCDNHTYESYALHLPSSDKLTLFDFEDQFCRDVKLTILVKTVVSTNNSTMTMKYCRYQYQYCCRKVLPVPMPVLLPVVLWQYFSLFVTFSDVHFFHTHLSIKLI